MIYCISLLFNGKKSTINKPFSPLYVAEPPDFEVTHGDPGEAVGLRPVNALGDGVDDVDAVHVVFVAQEVVEEEDLAQHVRDEDRLDDEVNNNKVVAVATTAPTANGAGEHGLDADRAAGLVLLLASQVPGERRRAGILRLFAKSVLV